MTAPGAVFQDIGVKFGWAEEVTKWMTDPNGLAAESIEDFLCVATDAANFTAILDTINPPRKLQQLSRVRQAWEALRKAAVEDETRKRKGQDASDLDALLDQTALDQMAATFHGRYHMTYPPDIEPADLLVSRLTRELDKRLLSLREVWKVRTLSFQLKAQRKRRHLGEDLYMIMDTPDEDAPVDQSVQSYLQLLFTLCLAYARAGVQRLPSAPAPTEEVRGKCSTLFVQVPLDTIMRYYFRAARVAYLLPQARALEWIQRHDETERGIWVDKFRNSSESLGAIIHATFERREAMWEPPEGNVKPPPPVKEAPGAAAAAAAETPVKKAVDVSKPPAQVAQLLKDGSKLCGAFNKGNCKAKGTQCAAGKHLCGGVQQGGRVCGGRHPACKCPNKRVLRKL